MFKTHSRDLQKTCAMVKLAQPYIFMRMICQLLALTPSFIGIHICIDAVQLCAWAANRGICFSNAFYSAPVGPGGSFQHPSASR